jgi:hypothetical protein
MLLGVWQVSCGRERDPDYGEMNRWQLTNFSRREQKVVANMKNTKFVVKLNRGGIHAPEFVQRIDRTPIQTTTNRKLALVMGRFAAEDAIKSFGNSRRVPELVSVKVSA